VARALTFAVLVLGNLALIFVNRAWSDPSWQGRVGSNPAFLWVAAAAVGVLAGVLGVPAVSGLFAFALPSAGLMAGGVGAAGIGLLWFEAVKWAFGRGAGAASAPSARGAP
jgi:Ca2+-transporting ATPase